MPISAGTRLGPYEIVSALGSGGMGEVYRARDTRLDRTVAIKVLPGHLSSDPDLRARLEREAKAISALQHPHICVLHDIGKEADVDFLVMEYLEGETLAVRLARKRLTLDESLLIATEIAGALSAAHRQGLIHRDLKPGNVMLTKSGAKLMDFGLAKPSVPAAQSFSFSVTLTSQASPITSEGTVVGTTQYMSPEQLQGMEADGRSDLFSFGATLYEMLSGRRAFEGKTQLSLASAILEQDPPRLTTLQPSIPRSLELLVTKCLAKDPEERWQSARDLLTELRWITDETADTAAGAKAGGHTSRRLKLLAWSGALLIILAVAVGGLLSWFRRPGPALTRAILSQIAPPENARFKFSGPIGGPPALAPDGHALAFVTIDDSGQAMLRVRPLDASTAIALSGTEGAGDPFWSPDSRTLGFFADGKLKTIDAAGGPPAVVASAPADFGGSWNPDGSILFVPDYGKGLYRVPAAGGNPVLVLPLDPSKYSFYAGPEALPDEKHFLYQAASSNPALEGTYFASLDGKQTRMLIRTDSGSSYAMGFLLYLRSRTLMAQTLDPASGQLRGEPYPVAEHVASTSGASLFSASQNGLLVYPTGASATEKQLTWFDRAGKSIGPAEEVGDYYDVRLSPDGQRLAFNMHYPAGAPNGEIWVTESEHPGRMRLTVDPETDRGIPVWSSDGDYLAFGALQGKARLGIYRKPSSHAGGEELLLPSEKPEAQVWPTSWSRDGRFLLYTQGDIGLSRADIRVLPLAGERKPFLFVKASAAAYDGQFSPDGRWVAYTSRESGRDEVYVVPFDENGAAGVDAAASGRAWKWLISVNGGRAPRWRRDGREIFYISPASQVMAVPVQENGTGIDVKAAEALFRAAVETSFAPYDVTPDGKKFVVNSHIDENAPLTLQVNWTSGLDTSLRTSP
jgi:Tol biopolymer transport system component